MIDKLNEFYRYLQTDKLFRGLFTVIIMWVFIEDIRTGLTEFIRSKLGISGEIIAVITLILILVVLEFIFFELDRKKRKELTADPTTEYLPEYRKYKGLIVSISRIKDSKKDIFDKIDAIKGVNDEKGLENAYSITGIGQTFRAIVHHLEKLEHCWLLCTEDVKDSRELVEYFIGKISSPTMRLKTLHVHPPLKINDPFKIEDTFKAINTVYTNSLKECNLTEKEVIADLTGGTAIMSCAMILACWSPDRDIEYVLPKDTITDKRRLIMINENIPEILSRTW